MKELDAAIDAEEWSEAKEVVHKAKEEFGEESAFYKNLLQYYNMYAVSEND